MPERNVERAQSVRMPIEGSAGSVPFAAPRPLELPGAVAPLRRPYYPRSYAVTDTVAGIERIFEDDISICIWRREPDPQLQESVLTRLSGREIERTERVRVDQPHRFESLLRDLADLPQRECLLTEIAGMSDLLSTLSDSRWVGVRLLVTRGAPCPRFHVDHVDLRLICTWQGPGTEWLEHQAVNRRCLGLGAEGLPDEQSGLLTRGAQIHRMRTFDIGIFKGELWPGNAGRGAVHRSPRPDDDGQWRIMVSVDGLD